MVDVRGIALGLAEQSPFAPPHRSRDRKRHRDGGASSFIGSLRTVIAEALDEAGAAWRPRIARYPY